MGFNNILCYITVPCHSLRNFSLHAVCCPYQTKILCNITLCVPLEQHSPWNVKKSNYSYNSSEAPSKRPFGSVNGVASPPTAKRKPNIGEAQIVRPTKANDLMFPARRSECIYANFYLQPRLMHNCVTN